MESVAPESIEDDIALCEHPATAMGAFARKKLLYNFFVDAPAGMV